MNIAVILSAGSGERFGKDLPKQFFLLNDKPIISYSLELFENFKEIDAFLVVSRKDLIKKTSVITSVYSKCLTVIEGGERRQDSVLNALYWIEHNVKNCKKVLIHDSARPFPGVELLKRLLSASKEHKAVIPVIKSDDTLKQKDGNFVMATLDREHIVRVQTPQLFEVNLLLDCYKKFPAEEIATDDAFLVEYFGHSVFCVEGERTNTKVTYLSDIKILEGLF